MAEQLRQSTPINQPIGIQTMKFSDLRQGQRFTTQPSGTIQDVFEADTPPTVGYMVGVRVRKEYMLNCEQDGDGMMRVFNDEAEVFLA